MFARPWTRTDVAHYAQMTLPSLMSGPAGMTSSPGSLQNRRLWGRPGKTTEDTEPEEPEAENDRKLAAGSALREDAHVSAHFLALQRPEALDEPPEASPRPTEAASGRFQAGIAAM